MITRRHMLASSLSIPILATPDIAMSAVTLATCVIEVRGEWHAPPESAKTVIARMRDACLAGVELRSEHQPQGLWVQNNPSGLPSIWLHDTPADVAWIMVDVGERAWSQLAYQFGHECGHVAANSWERNAVGPPPSRWLEETLVEAFSLRGLGLLAESWAKAPPFPGDNAYGSALRDYRDTTLAQYRKRASEQGATDLLRWWKREEPKIDRDHGLGPFEQAAVPVILGTHRARAVADRGLSGAQSLAGAIQPPATGLFAEVASELSANRRTSTPTTGAGRSVRRRFG